MHGSSREIKLYAATAALLICVTNRTQWVLAEASAPEWVNSTRDTFSGIGYFFFF